MRLSEIQPIGAGNYSYLQKVRDREQMRSFENFLRL